jgi:general secretion pathway protein D
VLDYLSDAGGFVINEEVKVRGTVDVWSKEPVTQKEAADLLNSVLRKNGYAATRNGRILTIIELDSAKSADLEIVTGNDPNAVPKSDEVVTQIIPVRYTTASQLVNNLQQLLPTSATLSVNESANSLLLVATRRDIKRMLRIVRALDDSLAAASTVKVYALQYADAKQISTVLQQLFASTSSSSSSGGSRQGLPSFGQGGFGGGPGGMSGFGGPGSMGGGFGGGPMSGGMPGSGSGGGRGGSGSGGGSGSSSAAGKRVVAVADESSNSVIVSATPDVITTISGLIQQLDVQVSDITEIRVFRLVNADATELVDQLTQLFPDDTRNSTEEARGPLRFGASPFSRGLGEGIPGSSGATSSSSSDRIRKMDRVLAVADPRTSALLVRAPGTLMPQIAKMIEDLDARAGRKEIVKVFELQNARSDEVKQVLQDLFNRNTTMRNSSSSSQQQDALATRQTQQNQQMSSGSSGFGGSGSSRSSGQQ